MASFSRYYCCSGRGPLSVPVFTQRRVSFMPYPEILIKPMRDELTQLGVQETRTPEEVDAAVNSPGTTMLIVNSVCGCAAGKARPGIAMALRNATLPDRVVTVFAGA